MRVWTIYRNGKTDEQVFNNDQEGINYAKERSMRAMVVFTANSRNQFEAYENGQMTSVKRKQKLSANAEEILMTIMTKEYKQFRGQKSISKQK